MTTARRKRSKTTRKTVRCGCCNERWSLRGPREEVRCLAGLYLCPDCDYNLHPETVKEKRT